MKKTLVTLLFAVLSGLWAADAWANFGHSTHNGSVSVSKVGEGTVYLSASDAATSGETSATWSCGGDSSKDSATYYLYAQPAEGWGLSGWSGSGTSTDLKFKVTPNASQNNGTYSYTATFKPYRQYRAKLTCEATEGGEVAIGEAADFATEVSTPEQVSEKSLKDNEVFSFAVHARANANWSFVRWADASGKELATTADYTHKVTSSKYGEDIEEVTITAVFAQSHTYYAQADVFVDESCAAGGLVALSRENKAPAESAYDSEATLTDNSTLADNSATFKYYAFAKCADDWWNFSGWYEGGKRISTDANVTFEVTTSSEDAQNPDGRSLAARFVQAPLVTATCERSAAGSYTVSGTCDTKPTAEKVIAAGEGTDSVALPRSLSITLSAATPVEGYKFRRWWKLGDNGSKVTLSESASVKLDVPADGLTVGADFIQAGLNFAVGQSYFENFADAVAAAQADGTPVSIVGNYEIGEDLTIASGVEFFVPASTKLTVSAGVTLTVDGTLKVVGELQNEGAITGAGVLARNYATVTQESEIHVPYPYGTDGKETGSDTLGVDATAGKYVVSRSATADHSKSDFGVYDCTFHWFVTVVTADGETLSSSTSADKPIGVLCTVNRKIALNWITAVGDAYTKMSVGASGSMVPNVYTANANYADNDQLFVMVQDLTSVKNGGSNAVYVYGSFDLAGHTLTFSDTKYNGVNILRFFNGCGKISSSSSNQIMNIHVMFYNCYKIGSTTPGASMLSRAYSSGASVYDSPDVSINWTGTQGSAVPMYNIYGGGTYSSVSSEKFFKAYWGTFKSKSKPADSTLADSTHFEWQLRESGIYAVAKKISDSSVKPAKIGETGYDTLKMALDAATAGQTVKLQKDITLTENLVVDAATDATLDLGGWVIAGDFAIENHGILEIVDDSGCVVPSEISSPIVCKAGNLYLAAATFSGDITVEGGKCDLLPGTYKGSILVSGDLANPQDCLEVTGGKYSKQTYQHGDAELQLVDLAPHGHVRVDGSVFHIGKTPQAYVTASGQSFELEAFNDSDKAIYTKTKSSTKRSYYTSRTEWLRAMEIDAGRDLVGGYSIDCTVVFDREVAANTVAGSSWGMTIPLKEKAVAGEVKSVLLPGIRDTTLTTQKAPWSYGSFMPGGDHDSLSFSVSSTDDSNLGTKCTLQMRYAPGVRWQAGGRQYDYDMTKSAIAAEHSFVFGAGSDQAMIFGDDGVQFYGLLSAALEAVAEGGAVKLCNDIVSTDEIAVPRICAIDLNGFEFAGSFKAPEGYKVVENAGVVTFESLGVMITVDDIANMDKVVTANGEIVTAVEGNSYQVQKGAAIVVTYTPNEGFFGDKIVKTIESAAEGASVTVSEEEASSVKAIVAKIGDTPYASLAEAVVAAAESGETIDVVKESTLTVAEGVELTVTSGKLVAAVPEDGVIELKDGTDAVLAWPTVAGAADHIIVTGGRYSADPSAFLAEGLEAKEKDGKFVVGVKVVIVIDEEQEAAEKTVTTDDQTSSVDEEKVDEVVQNLDVTEDEKKELVENIKTNTKVEGVKLTMVDEVTIPDPTKPDEKEVVRESGVKTVVLAAKAAAQDTAIAAEGKTDEQKTQDEKNAAAFKAALEQKEKDVEITVKVEVQAKLVEYVPPTAEAVQEAPKGTIKFELKPEAIVTVKVENEQPVEQKVPVSNDMIDQKQKIKVSMYAGFRPVQVLHRDDNGQLIEEFTGDAIGYENGIVSVMITHFSSLELNEAPVDPLAPADAVKVADGFYQNAATYTASTEFYITSKAGLEYFRDLVGGYGNVAESYIEKGFCNLTVEQFYQQPLFEGKTVKLLCDVDEGNDAFAPIGSVLESVDKCVFYGIFDGCGHKISNLRIVDEPATAGHRVGLFSRLCGNNGAGVRNLTINNAQLSAQNYLGGIAGSSGTAVLVTNCHLVGSVTISGIQYVGGMIGHVNGGAQVIDCSVDVSSGSALIGNQSGGVVGYLSAGNVKGCTVRGLAINAKDTRVIGGIVGQLPEAGCVIADNTVDTVTITAGTKDAAGSVAGSFGKPGQRLLNNTVINTHVYDPISNDDPSKLEEKFAQCQFIASGDTTSIVGWGIEWDANEKIIAGTFERIDDNAIASGYEKVAQGTTPETWVVQEKVVAKIGEQGYATLAAAFAAAKSGETVVILNGEHDCTAEAAFAKLGTKSITLKGESQSGTILNMGNGNKTGVETTPGTNLTLEDMTLKFDHSDHDGSPMYDHTFYHPASQTFRRVTIVGQIDIMDDTLFDTCTFTGKVNDKDEYLLWCYGCEAELVNCTFTGTGVKAPIKLYNEGAQCGLKVAATSFETFGKYDCAVYSSNDYPNNNVYEVTVGENVTVPAEKKLIRSSSTGLTVINPTKDADGKYTGGTFESETKSAEEIIALTKNYAGEGFAPVIDPNTGKVVVEEKAPAVAKVIYADGADKECETLLEAFTAAGTAKNVTIELLSDVDLTGVEWPLITFNGTFDGKDHTISNLKVVYSDDHSGFIRYSNEGAVVKNVTFKDSTIAGNRAAVVIGYGYGCTVEKVTVDGAVITGVQKCGGIVALVGEDAPLTITDCTVKNLQFKYAEAGKNEGSSFGGLVGYVNYGVNAVITGNEVSGISFVGAVDQATLEAWIAETGYSLDKASQWVCHPFIAAVMGTQLNTDTKTISVTLADNEAEQVDGLVKGPTTTEYLGFFYRDGTPDLPDKHHVVDITVDGVLMPNRAVAQIGETKYPSIAAAVEAAPAGVETTITVIADHEVSFDGEYSVNVVAGKNVIIDLNGHAIDVTATRAGATEFIKNNGRLTIRDTAEKVEGHFAGSISFTATNPDKASSPTYGSDVILNQSGTLVVAGGKLFNKSPNGACYVIDNNSGIGDTFLTVNDGELIATGSSCVRLVDFNEAGVYKNDVTINGAYFQAKYYDLRLQTRGAAAHVVVKGGEFYATDTTDNCGICVVSGTSAATVVEVTGGKFNSRISGKTATMALKGGIYAYDEYVDSPNPAEKLSTFVANGYAVVDNPDEETKAAYPWKVQEKTVTTDDGNPIVIDIAEQPVAGEPSVPVQITVTQELAAEILPAGTDVTKPLTEEQVTEIVTQLEAKGEDGMTGWQKYTAGFSQTDKHPLAPKGKGTGDGKLVLVTSLLAPKQMSVDTGVKVKYILMQGSNVDSTTGLPTKWDKVMELPTPEFPVDVTQLDPETYWKIEAEYTATKVVETEVEVEE